MSLEGSSRTVAPRLVKWTTPEMMHEEVILFIQIIAQNKKIALDCVMIAEFLVNVLEYTVEEIDEKYFVNGNFDVVRFNANLVENIVGLREAQVEEYPKFKQASFIRTIVKTLEIFFRSGGTIKQINDEGDAE